MNGKKHDAQIEGEIERGKNCQMKTVSTSE